MRPGPQEVETVRPDRHREVREQRVVERVRQLRPAKMRGERMIHNGITIYNDCYNSNPDAVRAMLDVLRATPARRVCRSGGNAERPLLSPHRDVATTQQCWGLMLSEYAALPALTQLLSGLGTAPRFFSKSHGKRGNSSVPSRNPAMRSCSRDRAECMLKTH
jgi:hypothetical protein